MTLEVAEVAFGDEQGLVDALLKEESEIRIGTRRVSILKSDPFRQCTGWPTLGSNPQFSSLVVCNGNGCPLEGLPKGRISTLADLDKWSSHSLKLLYPPIQVTLQEGLGTRAKLLTQGFWVAVGNGRPGGKTSLWTAVFVPPRPGQGKGTLGITQFAKLSRPIPTRLA